MPPIACLPSHASPRRTCHCSTVLLTVLVDRTSYLTYDQPMSDPGARSSVAHSSPSSDGPVHRAFALLQLVVSAEEAVGVRELGRRSGLSRSTTSRTLGILTDLGMVERTPDGGARPGAALAALTRRVEQSPAVLRDRFRPLAAEMRREYGENAAVGIDDGSGFLYLASARIPAAVQVADPSGQSYQYHLIAPGLVVMAHWPADRLAAHLASPLERATVNSVVKPAAIRRRLAGVRRTGHAWTDQELDLEVNGLAAPIMAPGGELLAVATLYGPSYRFAESLQPNLGAEFAAFVAQRAAPLVGSGSQAGLGAAGRQLRHSSPEDNPTVTTPPITSRAAASVR